MRKALGVIFLLVAFCLFGVGGFMLFQKFDGYKENEEIYDEVASIAVNVVDEDEEGDLVTIQDEDTPMASIPGMSENEYHGDGVIKENNKDKEKDTKKKKETTINWEELKGNNDIRGWIIFGDVVNYPIMQGDDNNYYLKHAYNGVANSNGSIFMNARNDADFRDVNTIIYGHNLKSGRMFGTFRQYLSKSKKDMHFYIYTPDGNKRTYEIVSVAEVKDGGFAYAYSFSKIGEYRDYLDNIKDASLYDTGYDVDETKRMVTLSTCRSTGSAEGWRVILVGKEVSIDKVQEPASWYKASTDEKITILDVEKNMDKTMQDISNIKQQRKEEELKNQQETQNNSEETQN